MSHSVPCWWPFPVCVDDILPQLLIHIVHFDIYCRSLSELDSVRMTGEAGDKIRQVTERATLFRITSNAMINVGVASLLRLSTSSPCLMCKGAALLYTATLHAICIACAGQINFKKSHSNSISRFNGCSSTLLHVLPLRRAETFLRSLRLIASGGRRLFKQNGTNGSDWKRL